MIHQQINLYLSSILNSRYLNELILVLRTFKYMPIIKEMSPIKKCSGVFYLTDNDQQWLNNWLNIEITSGIFITETEQLKQKLKNLEETSYIKVWWFEELKKKLNLFKFDRQLSLIDSSEVLVTPQIYFSMDIESDQLEGVFRWVEYLYVHEINWTFFICGEMIDHWEKKPSQLLKGLKNFPIGNHNNNHQKICPGTIKRAHSRIKAQFDLEPVVFRAPYLNITEEILKYLPSLNYKYDSSVIGFIPIQVVAKGREVPLIEIPILDGGDYVFYKQFKWDRRRYLHYFKKKIHYHFQLGNSFAILFHNQYSDFETWKESLIISLDIGYQLGTMDRNVSFG